MILSYKIIKYFGSYRFTYVVYIHQFLSGMVKLFSLVYSQLSLMALFSSVSALHQYSISLSLEHFTGFHIQLAISSHCHFICKPVQDVISGFGLI